MERQSNTTGERSAGGLTYVLSDSRPSHVVKVQTPRCYCDISCGNLRLLSRYQRGRFQLTVIETWGKLWENHKYLLPPGNKTNVILRRICCKNYGGSILRATLWEPCRVVSCRACVYQRSLELSCRATHAWQVQGEIPNQEGQGLHHARKVEVCFWDMSAHQTYLC